MNRRPRRRFVAAPEAPCPAPRCKVCAALAMDGGEVREFLETRMTQLTFDTGDTLPDSLLHAGGIVAVSHGAAVVQRLLNDGRRQVVGFRLPGEPLVLGRLARSVSAFTAIPTTLCVVRADVVQALKRKFPNAAMRLYELALAMEEERTEHLAVLGQFTVAEKVAYFLYRLANLIGKPVPNGAHMDLPMTREDIADYLGATSESVSRQISRLKRDGVIALPSPDRVLVLDMRGLRGEIPFEPAVTSAEADAQPLGQIRFLPDDAGAPATART